MNKRLIALIIIALILIWKFAISPSKLGFTDRVKTLQALNFAAEHKKIVTEYWKKTGALPTAEDWGEEGTNIVVDFQQSLVGSIQVGIDGPGTVTIYYTNARDNSISPDINGKKIILTPTSQGQELNWSCKGNLPLELLPKPCR